MLDKVLGTGMGNTILRRCLLRSCSLAREELTSSAGSHVRVTDELTPKSCTLRYDYTLSLNTLKYDYTLSSGTLRCDVALGSGTVLYDFTLGSGTVRCDLTQSCHTRL